MSNYYIITVESGYLRDTQIFTGDEKDDYGCDDFWDNISINAHLGLYQTDTPEIAIDIAAAEHDLPKHILQADLIVI